MNYDRGIPDDYVHPLWHYVAGACVCVAFWLVVAWGALKLVGLL